MIVRDENKLEKNDEKRGKCYFFVVLSQNWFFFEIPFRQYLPRLNELVIFENSEQKTHSWVNN
jgi:hypothetical protein